MRQNLKKNGFIERARLTLSQPVPGLLLLLITVFSLTSCQGGQFQADEHSPTPTEDVSGQPWLYVALGDSEALCCGKKTYPDFYAEFIEADLGVEVELQNLAEFGSTSEDLLELLAEPDIQNLLAKARVVTIVTTINDLLQCEMRDTTCIKDQLPVAMENYQKIIDQVVALSSPGTTIIRTQTYDNPLVGNWIELNIFEERVVMFDLWNQSIRTVAERNNLPFADVYLDFNGPNGDEDPNEKGYIANDYFHNTEEGAMRIAELLRDLGYDPYVP